MATARVAPIQHGVSQVEEPTKASHLRALFGICRKIYSYVVKPKENMAAECMVETSPSAQPPPSSETSSRPTLPPHPDTSVPSPGPSVSDPLDASTVPYQEPQEIAMSSLLAESVVKVKVTAATPPSPVDILESPGSDCPDGLSAQLAQAFASAGSDSHTDGGTGAETASSCNSTRRKKKRTRKHSKRPKSVTTVTEEARRVLDQYLKRSLSQNDASPLQREMQGMDHMEVIDEDFVDGPPSHNAGDNDFKRSLESFDDATSHSPESATRSLYSNSSHSSSFRHRIHIIRPLPDEKALKAALKKNKMKKNNRERWQSRKKSTSSSSSSNSDLSESGSHKKSLFKRATARLRKSIKKLKDKSPNGNDKAEGHVSRGGTKKKFSFKFGRAGSDKSPSSTEMSPAVPKDMVSEINTHVNTGMHQELNCMTDRNGSAHGFVGTSDDRRSNSHHNVNHRSKDFLPTSDKEKKTSLLDSLMKQIRKSGDKLRRKGSKEHKLGQRSRSADAITIHSVRPVDGNSDSLPYNSRVQKHVFVRKGSLGERGVHGVIQSGRSNNSLVGVAATCPDGVERFVEATHPASHSRQGHHSLRQRMKLDNLVPCQTSDHHSSVCETSQVTRVVHTPQGDVVVVEEFDATATVEAGFDELDYGSPQLIRAHQSTDDKPFHEKTDGEKEELYEKIAEQLAMIADTYDVESRRSSWRLTPLSPPSIAPSPIPEPEEEPPKKPEQGATASRPERPTLLEPSHDTGLERSLGLLLRQHGDAAAVDMPDFSPVVRDLVRNASYSKFQQIVNENIGKEPGWEQLALVFRLTQSAIQLAGMGTAVALQIKEHTLQYFEDRFAGWIIGQGGWESVVESDLDDEVD